MSRLACFCLFILALGFVSLFLCVKNFSDEYIALSELSRSEKRELRKFAYRAYSLYQGDLVQKNGVWWQVSEVKGRGIILLVNGVGETERIDIADPFSRVENWKKISMMIRQRDYAKLTWCEILKTIGER